MVAFASLPNTTFFLSRMKGGDVRVGVERPSILATLVGERLEATRAMEVYVINGQIVFTASMKENGNQANAARSSEKRELIK